MKNYSPPKIGIYYYPWYNATRWSLHPRRNTPVIGEYDSENLELIQYHVLQLQELGVDYVVIEMLPVNDWGFKSNFRSTQLFIECLKKTSIEYTFLIDTAVGTGHKDSCKYFSCLLEDLQKYDLIPTKKKNGKPLLLFFSTTLNEAFELRKEYGGKYFIIFPIFLPDWHVPDERCNEYLSAHGYDVLPGTPRYVSLAEVGYIQFWSDTKNLLQCKGFSAVIPGYDDLLLERSPQLAPVVYRDNGRTLIEQFQQALDSNAEEILIYGWNEYFEGTTIEPTLEYGEFYFELTARIIKKIKEGKRSCITIDLPLQSSMPPKYLNEELEISSQRYQDGIPRWDKDYYLAKFSMISEPFWENEKIVYKNIQVTNVGLKHWDDTIEDFPVLVGIQLLDDSGSVFQEGRGRLGGKTIAPGQSFITSLTLEIKGLGHGVYTVRVGMVCENKFWFSQIMLGDIVL